MSKEMTRRVFIGVFGGGVVATTFACNSRSESLPVFSGSNGHAAVRQGKPKVIRAYDPAATFWNYRDSEYLDFINQNVVDDMFERGITSLTGKSTVAEAWTTLMPTYRAGERIAIKPNFNAIHLGPRGLVSCPQLIRTVIKSLIGSIHASESDIYVYDLCKRIPESRIKDCIGYRVHYVERRPDGPIEGRIVARLGLGLESADKSAVVKMSAPIMDSNGRSIAVYMPKVIVHCDHLINIALLSNHPYLAITGPLKNHFGTVRFSNYASYPGALHGEVLQPSIVDINMNPNIRNKTRLLVCDALFGQFARSDGDVLQRWQTFPSKDGTPNSLFLATDSVAMESALLYFVNRERTARGLEIRSHDYLHLAAEKGLGIHEDFKDITEGNQISYDVV